MKIIATVSNGRFLVEATDDELARIAGYEYASIIKDELKRPAIGREVKVSALWDALKVTRGRHQEVAGIAKSLRTTADRVDSINKTLAAPIIETPATS